jgi:long-subunit acyl-CoA synthetase (AMP-forming)
MITAIPDDEVAHIEAMRLRGLGKSVAVLRTDIPTHLLKEYRGESALITWTSGTTGPAKGVITPWPAVDVRIAAIASFIKPEDVAITTSPLSATTSFGMVWARLAVHAIGGRFVAYPSAGKPVTALMATPGQLKAMVDNGERMKGLRIIVTGGAGISPQDKAVVEAFFQCPVLNGYGVSEIGTSAINGRVLDGYEIKTVLGRIHIRSKALATGYLRGEHFPVDAEGWYQTVDHGTYENGILTIKGRDGR